MKVTIGLGYPDVAKAIDLQLRIQSIQLLQHDCQILMVDVIEHSLVTLVLLH